MSSGSILATPHTLSSLLSSLSLGPLAILGLPNSFELHDSDVRRAYHTLAKQFHPDKVNNNDNIVNDENGDAMNDVSTLDELRRTYGEAFIHISKAYDAVKDAVARRRYINEVREAEIWREMKIKKERDQQEQQQQQQQHHQQQPHQQPHSSHSRPASSSATPMTHGGIRTKPRTSPIPTMSTPTKAAPSGTFPSFVGGRFKSNTHTLADRNSHPSPPVVSTPPPRPGVPPRTTFDVMNSIDSSSFASELQHWLNTFRREMESERQQLDSEARLRSSRIEPSNMEIRMGGRKPFSQGSISTSTTSNTKMLVTTNRDDGETQMRPNEVEEQTVMTTHAQQMPPPTLSRLQQLRARQGGGHTSMMRSTTNSAPSTSSPSPSSFPSSSAAAFLLSGGRLSLRTVAARSDATHSRPPSRSPINPSSSPSIVPISMWLSPSPFDLLQWRLVSSDHRHPDGVIQVERITNVRRVVKKETSASASPSASWFSIIQSDGSTMTLDATTHDMREQWVTSIEALIQAKK